MNHTKKVALITGAGSDFGRDCSMILSQNGYKVVLVDINKEKGEETLNLIREKGGESIFVKANVSIDADVKNYISVAKDTYGQIDLFLNNVGIIQKYDLLQDIEEDEFDRLVRVNIKGVFLGLKYVLKVMESQGNGVIINTTSTAGIRSKHIMSVYSATKHAAVGLTKSAALEYAKKGIRIYAICQGSVVTGITESIIKYFEQPGTHIPEELPDIRISRYADPQEIAKMILFLASEGSNYMTGTIIM
ncbi:MULTISPECIES: SDR family NAD(P)-dependent oxidoreductase [unclassified Bacillus (in: firmicutes)]|uniref:SDR family NAD(P)-dependent oxidoreductase n=1 Tax=unclassified Bacillus (in: firmicutes) TaxID=185979 RepID=UPI001BECA6C7|nr:MULTISPECIES: SDR family NAD(P)-dependent oxidoreductase [unclassified Bacillus (in: firmicutes)]MBT2618882.1 SDR family oxidoreductase [Bacillus sp. ISL-78]MBT2627858.1 SDR family oxidoreductase [Bacillus sp. ISL-101]